MANGDATVARLWLWVQRARATAVGYVAVALALGARWFGSRAL